MQQATLRRKLIFSADDILFIAEACGFNYEAIALSLTRIVAPLQASPENIRRRSTEQIRTEIFKRVRPEDYTLPGAEKKMRLVLKRVTRRLKK